MPMCGLGRNLSHPVAQQLESLVEQFNPDYNRKNKQRTKEVWGPKLMKSKQTEVPQLATVTIQVFTKLL